MPASPRYRALTLAVLIVGLVAVALLPLVACSLRLGAEPWQRDLLAKPSMRPDSQRLDRIVDDHIYFSKEASSGGRSFGGGGCGCN